MSKIKMRVTPIDDKYFDEDDNEEVSDELFIKTNGTMEGTYFKVGQVWETRDGNIKAKVIELLAEGKYPIVCEYYDKAVDKNFEFGVDKFRLIPTEELQPKTLSEYLKENCAYESFVENCVEAFLKDLAWYKVFKSENKIISLGNIFIFEDTKEGYTYWYNLKSNIPKPVECDMNEIIFTEVDRRNNMIVLADKIIEYSENMS